MRAQLQSFQIDLNIMLDNQGTQAEVDRFMDALQEFMSARAIDLSGFIDETNELKANIEGENAAAETRLEFAGLAEIVLASESGDSIRATEIGIREDAERLAVPNNEQIAVAAPVESLRETLKAETAKVAEELGMSEPSLLASMDAFAAAESMNV
jgi:hypothetical protein